MKNKKTRSLKLYFFISFLVVFILSFLVFYLFETQVRDIKLIELKENEESLIKFQNQLLGREFRMVLGDLHYLHHVYDDRLYDSNYKEIIANE